MSRVYAGPPLSVMRRSPLCLHIFCASWLTTDAPQIKIIHNKFVQCRSRETALGRLGEQAEIPRRIGTVGTGNTLPQLT